MPTQLVKNIKLIRPAFFLDSLHEFNLDKSQLIEYAELLKERLLCQNETVYRISCEMSKEYRVNSGVFLFLFRHLLAAKKLEIDMTNPINVRNCYFDKLTNRKGGGNRIYVAVGN
ncbi:TnsA endonuclease C-terminal domain-containing protein [Brevibacillus laterosporus]|uniref:TnsA endonuclease C-terminal domain-containing protein n=1 Tax=Brevibacillus laterosporus TaxID=1465 RepID=UPI00265D499D|nr:TnsA endonuclease C-terminal domain-containing protein [Brevibacillus laterosporus]